jgi:hypothetical protein
MASNTETVNGTVVSPNGSTLTSGEISFILSGRDIDDDANEVIHPTVITAVIGNDGTFSVALWPPDRGTFGTAYRVIAQGQTASGPVSVEYGNIQPLDGGGPFDLDDLLGVGVTGPGQIFSYLTEGQYNDVLAAATSAEEDATAAAASAATALGYSTTAAGSAADAATSASEAAASALTAADEASDAASSAASAASNAASSESSAIAAGAPIYADTTAGLAATSDGGFFYVPANGALNLYENDGGSEALSAVIGYPDFATLSVFKAAVAAGYTPPLGRSHKVNGADYVYDDLTTFIPGLSGWKFSIDPLAMLALGQSNTLGNPDATGGDKTLLDSILWWNGTGLAEGTEWRLPTDGTYPFNRTSDGGATYNNNMPYACARELSRRTGRPVAGMMYARGGHEAVSFVTPAGRTANGWTLPGGNTDISLAMYDGIANGLAALGKSVLDVIVIHQGEADTGDLETWADQWEVVLEELEAAGVYDPDYTRVVVGQISEGSMNDDKHTFQIVAASKLKTVTHGNLGYFRSTGVPMMPGDDVHFSGEGLVSLGMRAASAALDPMPGRLSVEGTYTVTLEDDSGNVSPTTTTGYWRWDDGRAEVWGYDMSSIDTTDMTGTESLRLILPFTLSNKSRTPGIVIITELASTNPASANAINLAANINSKFARISATDWTGVSPFGNLRPNNINSGTTDLRYFNLSYLAEHV